MNILVIDNGTIRLKELKTLLRDNKVKIIGFQKLDNVNIENFDLIVLSGSSSFPVVGNEAQYKQEIDLIKNSTKPIVGICLGFELIGFAYGTELVEMQSKEKGIIDLKVTSSNKIFKKLPNFSVYESHRWVIKKLPADLVELARSKDGIEAIKHKNRKVYGFQFHPEMFIEETCGDEIFNNLLKVLE